MSRHHSAPLCTSLHHTASFPAHIKCSHVWEYASWRHVLRMKMVRAEPLQIVYFDEIWYSQWLFITVHHSAQLCTTLLYFRLISEAHMYEICIMKTCLKNENGESKVIAELFWWNMIFKMILHHSAPLCNALHHLASFPAQIRCSHVWNMHHEDMS